MAFRFYVFQAQNDWHTPVEPVRQLEAWNRSVGHLSMEFHYYEGGHTGSDAAREEMARVLTGLVTR